MKVEEGEGYYPKKLHSWSQDGGSGSCCGRTPDGRRGGRVVVYRRGWRYREEGRGREDRRVSPL